MVVTRLTMTQRIAFGLAASAILVALTILVETGMAAILGGLLAVIWIPILASQGLTLQIRWALTALFAGTLVAGVIVLLVWELS